jgi:GNAT superfamily N-acetyltransferase
MKNIDIRQATEADISILESVLLDTVNWLNEMGQPLWSVNDVKWETLSKKHRIGDFYIAYTDGIPSGCMAMIDYDPFFWPNEKKGESLFIHKLAVTKASRKSGVSDALVNFSKEQGRVHGIDIIRLDTHAWRPKTRAFYERHGFIPVGVKVCESDPRKNTALYEYKLPFNNYNLFMQCDKPDKTAFRGLPDGFSFRLCHRDELDVWKLVVSEEQYVSYITEYYEQVYAKHADEFFRRCTFVCDSDDKPVASTYIWRSYNKINTVGWFRVLPEYEGRGLGRALLSNIFTNVDFPVFLHTQPTSAKAIKLYSDFGFKLLTDPTIGYRKNNLAESLPYLQRVLPESDYKKLQFAEADKALLEAALSSEIREF